MLIAESFIQKQGDNFSLSNIIIIKRIDCLNIRCQVDAFLVLSKQKDGMRLVAVAVVLIRKPPHGKKDERAAFQLSAI